MSGIRLTPDVVQKVRDALDIVDIASDITPLKRHGRKYTGLCPFHKEKTPSFNVDPDLGLYHCFGCGAGGDAIKLFMEHNGDDFRGAIEALARRYGIPLPTGPDRPSEERRDLSFVLEEAQAFFKGQLERSDFARSYLDRRQISNDLRQRFGLGYAPDSWQSLLDALRPRVRVEDLLAAGLVGKSDRNDRLYDRFRQRLMFPIHSPSGRLVGFGGRTLGDDRAKYVNTAETAAFRKGELLYGLHLAKRSIRDSGRVILVEGYFDVLGAVAAGAPAAVAGMGTALTPEQARLAARFADEIVLAYDGDEAGNKAASKSLPILLGAGLSVLRAPFPPGHDPDSLRLSQGPEAVVQLLQRAEDAVWQELDELIPSRSESDPRRQQQAADQIRKILRPINRSIVRDAYARRAAQRLGVPEGVLLRRDGGELFAAAVQPHTETRTEEQKAVFLLLSEEAPEPPLEELPPPGAFLDSECRNIFTAFCALYRDGRRKPSAREVLDSVTAAGKQIDSMAGLLVQDPVPEEIPDLLPTLRRLRTRWLKKRQGEIQREIRLAEQDGDEARLHALLEEKTHLSRHRHPEMTGRLWTRSRA